MGRWRRHLDPSIRRDSWQLAEDEQLRELYAEYGGFPCPACCLRPPSRYPPTPQGSPHLLSPLMRTWTASALAAMPSPCALLLLGQALRASGVGRRPHGLFVPRLGPRAARPPLIRRLFLELHQ